MSTGVVPIISPSTTTLQAGSVEIFNAGSTQTYQVISFGWSIDQGRGKQTGEGVNALQSGFAGRNGHI